MGYLYNTTFANNKPNFKRLPVAEIQQYNAEMDNRYKTNQQLYDKMELAISNMPIDAKDTPIMKNALNRMKSTVSEVVDRGELEMAAPMLRKAGKDLAMDKNVTGALQSHSMGVAYNTEMNKLKKMHYTNGKGITPDQYAMHTFKTNKINEGKNPVEYDPITGTYKNMFQGSTPAAFYDVESEARKIANALKADGYSTGLQASSVLSKLKVTDFKGVSVDKIYNAVVSMLQNNDRAKAYLNDVNESKMFMMTYANNGEEVKLDEDGKLIPNISEQNLINEGIDIEAKDKNGNLVYKNLYNEDGTINQIEAGRLIYGDNVNDIAKGATTFAWNTSSSKYYRDDVYMANLTASIRKKQAEIELYSTGQGTAMYATKKLKGKEFVKRYNNYKNLITEIKEILEIEEAKPKSEQNIELINRHNSQLAIYKNWKSYMDNGYNKAKSAVLNKEHARLAKQANIWAHAFVNKGSVGSNTERLEFHELRDVNNPNTPSKDIKDGTVKMYNILGQNYYATPSTFNYIKKRMNSIQTVNENKVNRKIEKYLDTHKTVTSSPNVMMIDKQIGENMVTKYNQGNQTWKIITIKGKEIEKDDNKPAKIESVISMTTEKIDGINFYFEATDEDGTHYYIRPKGSNDAELAGKDWADKSGITDNSSYINADQLSRKQYVSGMNVRMNQKYTTLNILTIGERLSINNNNDEHLADVKVANLATPSGAISTMTEPILEVTYDKEKLNKLNNYITYINKTRKSKDEEVWSEYEQTEVAASESEARNMIKQFENTYANTILEKNSNN